MVNLKKLWMALFCLIGSTACHLVWAETYEFSPPRFSTPANEMPKAEYVGQVNFKNGVALAAYQLSYPSSINDGWETTSVGDLNALRDTTFNATAASQLDVYVMPHGWILVPKKWKVYDAGHGADGSSAFLFAPDTTGKRYLSYFDTSACVGCAETDASLFFPNARASAKANDFLYYTQANIPFKPVQLRPTHVAFSYHLPQGGNPVNGLAIYDPANEGNMYRKVSIRLPEKDHAIASAILNWFVPAK